MSGTGKILVVEDNDFVRTQVVRYLTDAGFTTDEATDGDDALMKMSDDVALAIVDVRMEPLGGFEFIRIMQHEGYKTPVILVTGDQNPDLLEQANAHGVRTVLMKPVQKDRLISMVSRVIQRGA